MSKTAIATLKKAEAIMATAGVNVDLVPFLNDGKSRTYGGRKFWRNADKLALLIVDSAANAFQCESEATFADNGFNDMTQAVEAYISSNLDSWSQVELEDCPSFFSVDHLARLAEMVQRDIDFQKREADHAEALEMDKQATHFRREQAALTDRVRAIMGKPANEEERLNREYRNTMDGINYGPGANERRSASGQCRRCGAHRDLNDWADNNDCCPVCDPQPTHDDKVIDMNKARAKQQQTAANLPKPQMVDVVRAFLRTTPASQEQIDAVAKVSESELARLIRKFDDKGARITAHLTKSKSAGYGFLTFGYNGQLPPGTYHKMIVANMKNAREVASRYGALMWNF